MGLWAPWGEAGAWAAAGFGWVAYWNRRLPPWPFLHAFLTVLLGGASAVTVQTVCFSTYMAANPAMEASLAAAEGRIPGGPRALLFVMGIVAMSAYGALVGLATHFSIPRALRASETSGRVDD